MRIWLLLSFALGLPDVRSAEAAAIRPNAEELAVFCAAREEIFGYFQALQTHGDETAHRRLEALGEQDNHRMLPRKIRCGKRSVRLVPRGYGTYLEHFTLSDDGREMVVTGGYQAGYLDGASGICLFRKTDERWECLACIVTGAS